MLFCYKSKPAFTFSKSKMKTLEQCEICSKLTIKIPERRQAGHSGVFIVDFESISQAVQVFSLLPLNK